MVFEMNRTKNSFLNIAVALISEIIILALGLVVPRIVLTHYGSDTNGLTSTISQIFTYMALLNAGIGASARNALYKPIQDDNKEEISYIMSTARRYYRRISYMYFAAVFLMSIFLPFVLKTEIDYFTVAFYVFFEGLTNVVLFYFINIWTCFLTADGKTYITSTVALISKIFSYGIKIVLSLMILNIAFIQVGYFAISLVQLVIYYIYMKHKYPWIDYGKAPKEAKLPDKNAYIVTEVAWTIFSSTDMIILSLFVSTAMSSVYSIYSMVFVALNGFLNSIYSSILFNLGQTFVSNKEQYKRLHNIFNSVFIGGMTCMMCVAYILIIPFVKLYTAGITDVEYIYKWLPLLFCLIQLLSWSRYVAGNLTGIAGYAKQTSYVSLIEALINLVLSIVFVNIWGITGVLLATVLALPLKVVYCNWLTEEKILCRSPFKTILLLISNYAIFVLTIIMSNLINLQISSYFMFSIYGIIFSFVYFILLFLINGFVNNDVFKFAGKGLCFIWKRMRGVND